MEVICKDCGEKKPTTEFYGMQGECKVCTKKRVRLREDKLRENPEWVEKEKQRHRKKYHRLGYKDKHKPTPEKKKEIMERYKKKYPEKINAHLFLLSKKLKAQIDGNHLHHWNYNKEYWLSVIELSETDHNKAHRYMIYDQERMMYRRTDTNELLDTREAHEAYINWIIENKE